LNALIVAAGFLITPSGELKAALEDAKKLPQPVAQRTRYLTLHAVQKVHRDDTITALNFWANSLSKEAEFAKVRRVTPTIVAIVLDDYGWPAETWEKLADEDPFFHQTIKVEVGATFQKWSGGYVKAEAQKAGLATVPALWLPQLEAVDLAFVTQSQAPILRADWWLSRVSIQAGRNGTGYYDWFAVKDRAAFEKLLALDVKESQRVKKEVAGIVARSNVANLPRQVFRFQSITGGYWVTRDVLDDNRDGRNALRNLDADFKHQAEEIYGVLPNGLFAFFLSDDKGVRQDSAPDKISSDETAPGRDRRIHVGLSCVRCHVEGLRPINDWARRVYSGPLKLASPDAAKLRRLQQLYLGELQEKIDDDVTSYTRRLKRLTDKTPEQMAKVVGQVWAEYVERDILPADAARELGLPEAVYMTRLKAYFASNQLADPVLASHIAGLPIRADDFEEVYPLVAPIVLGVGK
jgi:hypothetical protein